MFLPPYLSVLHSAPPFSEAKILNCYRCFLLWANISYFPLQPLWHRLVWDCLCGCVGSFLGCQLVFGSPTPWSSKWNPESRSPCYLRSSIMTRLQLTKLTPVTLWMQSVIISSLVPNLCYNSFPYGIKRNHRFFILSVHAWKFPYSFLHDLKTFLNLSTIEILPFYLKLYYWSCYGVKMYCQWALYTTE